MEYSQTKPSLSQAQRIKRLSQEGKLWKKDIRQILNEDKKRYTDRIIFDSDQVKGYFPEDFTGERIKEEILNLLERHFKRKQVKRS